ncbi:MAG: polyketide cyclase [Chloroflexota bacterium]
MSDAPVSTSNEYVFVDRWRVRGAVQEVSDIIGDAPGLVTWWGSVYESVEIVEPGDARGVGQVVRIVAHGRLPYTVRFSFRITESRAPHGFSLEAWGDFNGTGMWTFAQVGPWVDVRYDWRIKAEKPVLKWLSFALKPIFAWNHRWCMAQGQEGLRRLLESRRPAT